MLRNIPSIISPALLKILDEMGHSDRILITDANYPAESMGMNTNIVRCDGHGVPELLEAILKLIPLDASVKCPVSLMAVQPQDRGSVETPIWASYKEIISKYDERGENAFQEVDRFEFYEQSKTAYCIVYTGENKLYANIMLQKGVLKQEEVI